MKVGCNTWGTVQLVLVWILVSGVGLVRTAQHCDIAQAKCVSRVGCGMALHNYQLGCGALIYGETDHCTPRCQKALISLLSTEDREGEAFMECDCDGLKYCQNQKKRLEVCSRDVLVAMRSVYDTNTDISCSLAEMICRADTSCLTALEYYQRHCRKMFSGDRCTPRCNNSLAILYRQTKAWKLRSCICDGTEEYPCQTIQERTERLCFRQSHVRIRHRHNLHHNRTRTALSNWGRESHGQNNDSSPNPPNRHDDNNHLVNLASGTKVRQSAPLTLAIVLLLMVTWNLS